MTSKALTVPSSYAVVQHENAASILADAFAPGEEFGLGDLPRIKAPAAGSTTFELPNGVNTKAFEAVILHRVVQRAFWVSEFTGEGNQPDCSSSDNIHGVGLYGVQDGVPSSANPTGLCKSCPMAQFGSKLDSKGNAAAGQACRQITRLYLMLPDSLLPVVFNLPPSSYKNCHQYVAGLAAFGRKYFGAVTKLSAVPAKSEGGITYAQIQFEEGERLDPESLAKLLSYRAEFLPAIEGASVEAAVD